MKIRREHGAVAMIIDPCQVPTVAAKAFVPATRTGTGSDAGGRRREERDPDSGGIRRESGRKVEGGSWTVARGTEGESMTYAEAGSARDSAQFPASLANDQQRAGGRLENSLDKGFALSPPSSHPRSFLSSQCP